MVNSRLRIREDNDSNSKVMITWLLWTAWTSVPAVRETPLNLITHHPFIYVHILNSLKTGDAKNDVIMMTSSNGNIFRVTVHLYGESPMNSPHKGQWRGALVFSLICTWINGWVNNREAGDLRCHQTHYDVTVMWVFIRSGNVLSPVSCQTISWSYASLLSLETITINSREIWNKIQTMFQGSCKDHLLIWWQTQFGINYIHLYMCSQKCICKSQP